MGDTVHDELKKLVAELGQDAGLNQPSLLRKRIAERFSDPLVAEVLVSTVAAEVPKRLREMAAISLTRTAVVNYAKQVAGKTGWVEDVARWAIEAWADALGLAIAGSQPPPITESLQQLLGRLQTQRIQPPTVAVVAKTPATAAVATKATAGANAETAGIAVGAIGLVSVIVIIYFAISYFNKPYEAPFVSSIRSPLYEPSEPAIREFNAPKSQSQYNPLLANPLQAPTPQSSPLLWPQEKSSK
jgi:hypothetical protein